MFSLMAKKIKALELNQSMFDRYVEALNARYSDRFEDVARDVSDVESRAANATAEARAAAAAAAAAAEECDATVRDAARRHSGDAAAADERVRALRAELDATRRAWRISFGVGLLVVAGLAALLAAASAAHAVAVSGKKTRREGTCREGTPCSFPGGDADDYDREGTTCSDDDAKSLRVDAAKALVAAAALAASASVVAAAVGCWILFGPTVVAVARHAWGTAGRATRAVSRAVARAA